MKKLLLTLALSLSVFNVATASSKIYLDEKEVSNEQDGFYIHVGNNHWIKTETIHKDKTGMFTYSYHIASTIKDKQISYEKTWKCPYCYNYWKIGEKCQNKDCPSKY